MKDNGVFSTNNSHRALLYQFLALALYEPSESLLAVVEENNAKELLAAAKEFIGSPGEKLMQDCLTPLQGQGDNQVSLLQDLRVEYNRLFVGPASPVCPPYESFYDRKRARENWGTLDGPTADAMAQVLREEGLELTLDHAELPDHGAIELEFMYYLLSRGISQDEDSALYLQKAHDFFTDHLSKWLPEFGTDVHQQAKHPFYQGLGLLISAVINKDLNIAKPKEPIEH